jgi:hypothetical protein
MVIDICSAIAWRGRAAVPQPFSIKVRSGWLAITANDTLPPRGFGAALLFSRQRCSHLTVELTLTSKRSAASCRDAPAQKRLRGPVLRQLPRTRELLVIRQQATRAIAIKGSIIAAAGEKALHSGARSGRVNEAPRLDALKDAMTLTKRLSGPRLGWSSPGVNSSRPWSIVRSAVRTGILLSADPPAALACYVITGKVSHVVVPLFELS